MASSILHLLALLLIALVSNSDANQIDRCATDPAYSYRVCNAIRSYLQARTPCDKAEIIKLQRRITLLRSALKTLQKERNAEISNRQTINCSGRVYRNRCYFILDERGQQDMMTYDKARNACRAHQGKMATINSKALYDFIYDFVEKNARDFTRKARSLVIAWTGASYKNGQIFLPDNTTSNFAEWSMYHPTNVTAKDRVSLAVAANTEIRGMFDSEPSMRMYPLCEKDTSL